MTTCHTLDCTSCKMHQIAIDHPDEIRNSSSHRGNVTLEGISATRKSSLGLSDPSLKRIRWRNSKQAGWLPAHVFDMGYWGLWVFTDSELCPDHGISADGIDLVMKYGLTIKYLDFKRSCWFHGLIATFKPNVDSCLALESALLRICSRLWRKNTSPNHCRTWNNRNCKQRTATLVMLAQKLWLNISVRTWHPSWIPQVHHPSQSPCVSWPQIGWAKDGFFELFIGKWNCDQLNTTKIRWLPSFISASYLSSMSSMPSCAVATGGAPYFAWNGFLFWWVYRDHVKDLVLLAPDLNFYDVEWSSAPFWPC